VGRVSAERIGQLVRLPVVTRYNVAIDLPLRDEAVARRSTAGLVEQLESALEELSGTDGGDVERAEVGTMTRRGGKLVRVRIEGLVRARDAAEAMTALMDQIREAVSVHERDWNIAAASGSVSPA
jgi:hypothetical protein